MDLSCAARTRGSRARSEESPEAREEEEEEEEEAEEEATALLIFAKLKEYQSVGFWIDRMGTTTESKNAFRDSKDWEMLVRVFAKRERILI